MFHLPEYGQPGWCRRVSQGARDGHLWRETPLYTEEAEAPWRRFCAALLPALLEARAARFGGGESLHKPAAQTPGCEELHRAACCAARAGAG